MLLRPSIDLVKREKKKFQSQTRYIPRFSVDIMVKIVLNMENFTFWKFLGLQVENRFEKHDYDNTIRSD